jgi:hypothetical protein
VSEDEATLKEKLQNAVQHYIEELEYRRRRLEFNIFCYDRGDSVPDIEFKRQTLATLMEEISHYRQLAIGLETGDAP